MPLKFKEYLFAKTTYEDGASRPTQPDGKIIYKLSSNENPLGSSPKALAAIEKCKDHIAAYPDSSDQRLRIALERFYKGKLSPNQFVTTNSGVANIELIINGFMEPDTECIFSNPAFGPYNWFPQKVGAISINIPLVDDNFQLDVDGILQAINEKTRIIFVTNPNNPTGTLIPKKEIDRLIMNVPDHVVIVYDEVYYQYVDTEDYVRGYEYVNAGKNVIAVNSFSKAYGLAGLRIGYSYTTVEIANYLNQLRRPFMINTISMEAAIAALGDDDFISQTIQNNKTEKEFLYDAFDEIGIRYWKTEANFILIKPKIDADKFEALMLEHGVMVRQVANFGAPGCVRVTIGTRKGNEAFILALKKVFL